MSQSKYQAGFGVIFWDKKSQTLMIPIYSTTVLYDTILQKRQVFVQWVTYKVFICYLWSNQPVHSFNVGLCLQHDLSHSYCTGVVHASQPSLKAYMSLSVCRFHAHVQFIQVYSRVTSTTI